MIIFDEDLEGVDGRRAVVRCKSQGCAQQRTHPAGAEVGQVRPTADARRFSRSIGTKASYTFNPPILIKHFFAVDECDHPSEHYKKWYVKG